MSRTALGARTLSLRAAVVGSRRRKRQRQEGVYNSCSVQDAVNGSYHERVNHLDLIAANGARDKSENTPQSISTVSTIVDENSRSEITSSKISAGLAPPVDTNAELLVDVIHPERSPVTAQNRQLELADAAANFSTWRRHFIYHFDTPLRIASATKDDRQDTTVTQHSPSMSAGVKNTEDSPDCGSVVPDSEVSGSSAELMLPSASHGSEEIDGVPVCPTTSPVAITGLSEPNQTLLQSSYTHDICLSKNFRISVRPPTLSSLVIADPHSTSQSHLGPHTPPQDGRNSVESTFTSPDRIPDRISEFSGGLMLTQLLASNVPHAVYYPSEHGSCDSRRIDLLPDPLERMSNTVLEHKRKLYVSRARCVRFRQLDSYEQQEWLPEKLERGYWLIDVSNWRAHERVKFWENMTKLIQTGRIGWVGAVIEEGSGSNIVRVYCFGAVIVHIWACLYIVSHRRTAVNVKWIDGAGRVVIEVDGH